MICCLIGVGIVQMIEWIAERGVPLKYGASLSCALLLMAGAGSIFRDLTNPYKTRSDYSCHGVRSIILARCPFSRGSRLFEE